MKSRVWGLVSLIALGALTVVIGCNQSKQENNTTATATVKSSVRDTVIIDGMQFTPAQLTITKGDTVVWINKDIVAHNVTEDTAQTWTSGELQTGQSWTTVPDSSFNYLCSIHPTMKGAVYVNAKDNN